MILRWWLMVCLAFITWHQYGTGRCLDSQKTGNKTQEGPCLSDVHLMLVKCKRSCHKCLWRISGKVSQHNIQHTVLLQYLVAVALNTFRWKCNFPHILPVEICHCTKVLHNASTVVKVTSATFESCIVVFCHLGAQVYITCACFGGVSGPFGGWLGHQKLYIYIYICVLYLYIQSGVWLVSEIP